MDLKSNFLSAPTSDLSPPTSDLLVTDVADVMDEGDNNTYTYNNPINPITTDEIDMMDTPYRVVAI